MKLKPVISRVVDRDMFTVAIGFLVNFANIVSSSVTREEIFSNIDAGPRAAYFSALRVICVSAEVDSTAFLPR